MWEDYVHGKQTYQQLSVLYNCSVRTIQRRLDKITIDLAKKAPKRVVLLIDTTYWKRSSFGVMLFKDSITGENLLKYYIKYETNALYYRGVVELKNKGYEIDAIVCDGRKGLIKMFKELPVQMCIFHQSAIIRRYLTKNPKMEASKELMKLVDLLKMTDKESFQGGLEDWYQKWQIFLYERSVNPESGKSHYTHKRLRSAYKSLKSNLPWLFTWYDNIGLNIPSTTNAIDGHFSDLKKKLRCHNGLSEKRKKRFIDEFLKA